MARERVKKKGEREKKRERERVKEREKEIMKTEETHRVNGQKEMLLHLVCA